MSVRVLSRNYKPTYVAGTKYDPKWEYIRQHCVGFWPFWERRSNTLENWAHLGLRPAITFGTASAWQDLTNGPGIHFDGTGYVDTLIKRLGAIGLFAASTEQWTVVTRSRCASNAATVLFGRSHQTTTSRVMTISFATGAGPAFRIRGTSTVPGWALDDSGWHTIWVVWDGTTCQAYHDAALGVTTLGVGAIAEGTENIVIGAASNYLLSTRFIGDVDFAAILDVPLSPAQIVRWNSDPMAPWRPARRWGRGVATGSAVLSGTVLT